MHVAPFAYSIEHQTSVQPIVAKYFSHFSNRSFYHKQSAQRLESLLKVALPFYRQSKSFLYPANIVEFVALPPIHGKHHQWRINVKYIKIAVAG